MINSVLPNLYLYIMLLITETSEIILVDRIEPSMTGCGDIEQIPMVLWLDYNNLGDLTCYHLFLSVKVKGRKRINCHYEFLAQIVLQKCNIICFS